MLSCKVGPISPFLIQFSQQYSSSSSCYIPFFQKTITATNKTIASFFQCLNLMPLTTTAFNSFLAKKKPRGSTTDELSVVKAAAWAWYQRGSGSEGKPMGEFDIRRTQRDLYRPSRYKLEAMKIGEQDEEEEEEEEEAAAESQVSNSPVPSNPDNNSLLDKFEIASISKRLGQLIDSSTGRKLLSAGDHDDDDRKKNVSRNSSNSNGMMKKKGKKSRGFWLMKHAVICGTRQDVVADARLSSVNRPPEKQAAVVKLATCRPRVTHA